MSDYLIYLGVGLGALLLALIIPGIKVLAEALLKLFFELFVGLFKHKGNFVIWFIKTLFSDHARIFKHALTARDEIDPTQKIRRKAQGYED